MWKWTKFSRFCEQALKGKACEQYADRVILFTCFSKDKVLSRMTPRLLTWVDEEIIVLSTESEKLLDFD